jgi:seryl-tRNA synthetase
MLDIKFIRENSDTVRKALRAKHVDFDLDAFLELDGRRREFVSRIGDLRAEQNRVNDEIAALRKQKQDAAARIEEMKELSSRIKALEEEFKPVRDEFEHKILFLPNIPHVSVPEGDPSNNKIVREWGTKPELSFKPQDHITLSEKLDIMDFKTAAKITGAGFSLYKGMGALLERALIQFMLDLHVIEHGYTEVSPPFVVNRATMTGTGQLPKLEDDMYRLKDEDFFLIPTAEVPVTNIHRDTTIDVSMLPVKYVAYTPCFRREAGSYGKDTRGLVRLHQFDKVELVKFVRPETSYDELESLVGNAERVLQILNIPYRVVLLADGDLSFAAAKCYDLEIYAAGLDRWLEVSSCSNFEDFQARRSDIRFKDGGKKELVHTLNGSGVALARLVVAILENYQNADGSITIPEPLRKYMHGRERIG